MSRQVHLNHILLWYLQCKSSTEYYRVASGINLFPIGLKAASRPASVRSTSRQTDIYRQVGWQVDGRQDGPPGGWQWPWWFGHACTHARHDSLCMVYSAERPCKAAAAESTQLIRWGSRTDWQYKMWTQFVNVNSLSSDNETREKETGGKASSETAKLESHQHGPRT